MFIKTLDVYTDSRNNWIIKMKRQVSSASGSNTIYTEIPLLIFPDNYKNNPSPVNDCTA